MVLHLKHKAKRVTFCPSHSTGPPATGEPVPGAGNLGGDQPSKLTLPSASGMATQPGPDSPEPSSQTAQQSPAPNLWVCNK